MMKLPKIKSYGDYSSENYGLHCMMFEDSQGNEFYFSYNTLVAFVHKKNAYENERHVPVCVKTEYVDGENIKADTWYQLKNGKFVEVNE